MGRLTKTAHALDREQQRALDPGRRSRSRAGAPRRHGKLTRLAAHGAAAGPPRPASRPQGDEAARRHLDAGPDRLQGSLSRHARRLRVGAAQAGDDARGASGRVLVRLRQGPRLPPEPDRWTLPVGLLCRGHQGRPRFAPREGLPDREDALPALDSGGDVELERARDAGRLFARHGARALVLGPASEPPGAGALRPLPHAALPDRARLLARGERAVPSLPRSQPGVGAAHARGLLRRADRLSARDHARALSLLSVPVAARRPSSSIRGWCWCRG